MLNIGFPKRIEIELVSDCNLKCTYCPRHYVNELTGYIELELFKKIIDECKDYPELILVLHRRGESMLHLQFNEMMEMVSGRFKEVQMATNATKLHESKFEAIVKGLDFISFSLDTPHNFNKTRLPAKYDIVEKNILNFLDYNQGRVKTQVSMVKTDLTPESDCELFKSIWEGRVDRVRVYEEHSKDGEFGALKSPRAERKPCVMPSYEILVYDNGKVARCNHDWSSDKHDHYMGDLNTTTIKELWHSDKYKDLREQHKCLDITDPVCSKCDSWYPEIGNQGTGEVVEK